MTISTRNIAECAIIEAVENAETIRIEREAPDVSILRSNRRPPPDLPLDVFGPFWGRFIESAATGSSAPAGYVAGGLLAAASAVIGNARWVSAFGGNWLEPPVLWVGLVGDPASGKSPALNQVRNLLRHAEVRLATGFQEAHDKWESKTEKAGINKGAWEKRARAAADKGNALPDIPDDAREPPEPKRPRVVVSDATIEALALRSAENPRGLIMHRDELAAWLGNFDRYGGAGGDRAFWLEAHEGRPHTVDRAKNGGTSLQIGRLSIGILGTIQPERLTKALLNGDDDGLPARFTWLWPDRVQPVRPHAPPDLTLEMRAFEQLAALDLVRDERGCHPVFIPLSRTAEDRLQEFREEIAGAADYHSGMLASAHGKAPGRVVRLALVIEYLWWAGASPLGPEPREVTAQSLIAAAHLWTNYLWPMAERVYGDASLPQDERDARAVAKWIAKERPQKVNARAMRRGGMLERDTSRIAAALSLLVEYGWLAPAPTRAGDTSGRRSSDYLPAPGLWEALA